MKKLTVFWVSLLASAIASPTSETFEYRTDYDYIEKTKTFYKLHRGPIPSFKLVNTCAEEGAVPLSNTDEDWQVEIDALFQKFPTIHTVCMVNVTRERVALARTRSGEQVPTDFCENLACKVTDVKKGLGCKSDETLEEAGYNKWSFTEPNNVNGQEYCGSLLKDDGDLNDLKCSDKYGFICEHAVDDFIPELDINKVWYDVLGLSVSTPPSSTPVTKKYRNDYEYDQEADIFYKVHYKKKVPLEMIADICLSEGAHLAESSQEEIKLSRAIMRKKPDLQTVCLDSQAYGLGWTIMLNSGLAVPGQSCDTFINAFICKVKSAAETHDSDSAPVTIPTPITMKYRNDYEYDQETDMFYKQHSLERDSAADVCASEGGSLIDNSPEDMKLLRAISGKSDRVEAVCVDNKGNALKVRMILMYASEVVAEHATDSCFGSFFCKVKAAPETQKSRCGNGTGYRYFPSVGSCYSILKQTMSWDKGLAFCREQGAHLAVVNSVEEHHVLHTMMNQYGWIPEAWNHGYFHIGFKADGNRNFKTIFNETLQEAGYNKWSNGEPNNKYGDEYCGSLNIQDAELNDIKCSDEYGFICEKEVEEGTITEDANSNDIQVTTDGNDKQDNANSNDIQVTTDGNDVQDNTDSDEIQVTTDGSDDQGNKDSDNIQVTTDGNIIRDSNITTESNQVTTGKDVQAITDSAMIDPVHTGYPLYSGYSYQPVYPVQPGFVMGSRYPYQPVHPVQPGLEMEQNPGKGVQNTTPGPFAQMPPFPIYVISYVLPVMPVSCPCYFLKPGQVQPTPYQTQGSTPYGIIGFAPVVFVPNCPAFGTKVISENFPNAEPVHYKCDECHASGLTHRHTRSIGFNNWQEISSVEELDDLLRNQIKPSRQDMYKIAANPRVLGD